MNQNSLDISFVLITFNEEDNIRRTIEALPKGAEVVVLDSGSTDRTVVLAEELGAKVYFQEFSDYASQKNKAISYAKRSWIVSIDADEEMDQELVKSLITLASSPASKTKAFCVKRKLLFMGRILRFGGATDAPLRVFPRDTAEFTGEIHEKIGFKQKMDVRVLPGSLIHRSFRDLSDYFERFNRYSTRVAEQNKSQSFTLHLLRPWFEFIRRYVFLGGFLDGYPGYTYALISSLYAFVKQAKYFETKVADKNA